MSLLLITMIAAIVIVLFARASGKRLLDDTSELLQMKHSPDAGKKKEKAIFGVISRRTLPARAAPGAFERPLDITPNVPADQVLPPPEPVQGVNAGNEVI